MDIAKCTKYILTAAVLISGFVMGSCTSQAPAEVHVAATEPTAAQTQSYDVSFVVEGREVKRMRCDLGEFPAVPEVEDVEGARFAGWINKNGRKAQPANTPINCDTEYTAVFLPILDGDAPYLFSGSDGLLRPDDILDSTDLVTALNALAGEAAKARFPDLSAAEDDVTVDELRAVLLNFYTSEELDRVILGHDGAEKISRSAFALIMNQLLQRDAEARILVAEDTYCIPDISPARQDFDDLLEATVAHTHSESGSIWRKTQLPALYEEGYVLVDGALYCVGAEGYFICDTVIGNLTFGYDGRFTSGDAMLDSYVSAIIADIAEVNNYTRPGELLEAVYDYCCENFTCTRGNIYEVGARGWEMAEAVTMFETRSGNGCSYAGAFWALARGIGYEATAVNGTVGADRLPHAWVEIEIDGKTYIFDPGTEAGVREDFGPGRDMFMISEKLAENWKYFKG